jgi:hypothetical protein
MLKQRLRTMRKHGLILLALLVTMLFYAGKPDLAKAAFDTFYHGDDAATFWAALQTSVEHGRFYVVPS